ncbi:DUF502 domain-containing protein [Spartinivicinus ruber]|uniref:DUF502 domain-containing protein n=1 Tax=Spartinivicinus ruber TaxID=2683272 RepID=UPI0013CF83FD|nr:DUF502 domain-containing protein [Spartinivicinus ruber]
MLDKSPTQRLIGSFLKGAAIVLPIVLSFYLIIAASRWIDGLVGLQTPGLGLLVVVVGMTLVGAFTSHRLGHKIVSWFQELLNRIPILKMLHGAISDVFAAVVGNKTNFNQPVLVSLGIDKSVKLLGFMSEMAVGLEDMEEHVSVYLPQSFNIAGNLLLVPKSQVTLVDMDPGKFMTLILSGGIVRNSEDNQQ